MMSQLLHRLLKLSSQSNGLLIHKKSVRLFSTSPYMTLGTSVKEVLADGCKIGDVILYDPAKEELVRVKGKTIPKEIFHEEMIGASHGWGFFCARHDLSVRISDIFNPLASKSNPAVIPLPRLTTLPSGGQTEEVCNVAMSSTSPQENCVVAIKFSGCQLSLCRLGVDHEWTNLLTPFNTLDNSNVVYSKRDQRFYLPAPGGNYLFSYHPNSKEGDSPEIHELCYRGHPVLDQSEWEVLSSCSRTEYLVESPSTTSERFLVKWYAQGFHSLRSKGIYYKTKKLMVFSEEETLDGRVMCYTEDIGDMCIFLAMNEAFCIPASSCPGLKPNTIYFMGRGFGFYDLTTQEAHHYSAPHGAPTVLSTPYWLPPFST